MDKGRGRVYLVGAGPGAPDLISLRAIDRLRNADVVIYDYLVSPEVLRFAPESAELIFAGRRGDKGDRIEQGAINRMLIASARRGRSVVRLKGGDPFIFGRGGEEAQALADAGIEFEVVPGVSSAVAAPAFAGIPLTHRHYGSFVTFVTGHEDESKGAESTVPWSDLARAARSRGTLVILMATARMRSVLARLAASGMRPDTPAAAVQWGTTAAQVTILATVGTLAEQCEAAKLGAPTVVVVGEAAALREKLKWFEAMPLFGKRIVITRTRVAAADFAQKLRALGADAIEFPTIEIAPPSSYSALDGALERLNQFDWIVFTSATGVERFIDRMRTLGHDLRALSHASLCAIGPATASALATYALRVATIPSEYRAEAIIPAIGKRRVRGARFLIPRAQVAREVLPQELRAAGAKLVEVASVYRTVKPRHADTARIRAMASSGQIDLVVLTSSSTAENFAEMVGSAAKGLKAAAIGPITAETAKDCGFLVKVQPEEYTTASLLDAIFAYFRTEPQPHVRRHSS